MRPRFFRVVLVIVDSVDTSEVREIGILSNTSHCACELGGDGNFPHYHYIFYSIASEVFGQCCTHLYSISMEYFIIKFTYVAFRSSIQFREEESLFVIFICCTYYFTMNQNLPYRFWRVCKGGAGPALKRGMYDAPPAALPPTREDCLS